jgi:hypothetical protein
LLSPLQTGEAALQTGYDDRLTAAIRIAGEKEQRRRGDYEKRFDYRYQKRSEPQVKGLHREEAGNTFARRKQTIIKVPFDSLGELPYK